MHYLLKLILFQTHLTFYHPWDTQLDIRQGDFPSIASILLTMKVNGDCCHVTLTLGYHLLCSGF